MNQVTIAGHLGSDPEVRFTSSGQKVTTFRVGAKVRRSTKGDETIWWRITIWGDQFDKLIPHLKKGSGVIVFGELSKPEIFTDKEGRSQVSMNVTAQHISFSPFGRPEGGQPAQPTVQEEVSQFAMNGGGQKSPQRHFGQGGGSAHHDLLTDEEIPF